MIPDAIATTITILENTSEISGLVGSRLYGIEIPDDQHNAMPVQSIVVSPAGNSGGGHGYMRYGKTRLDIRAYGETHIEASEVFRAVYERLKHLKRETINNVLVHDYTPTGGPLPFRDPDNRWPVINSTYIMAMAEELVA